MERNEHKYDREFRNKLHNRDEDYGRSYDRGYDRNYGRNRDNENEQFENYRDRYSSHGNYYGMHDNDYEYRNVRSTSGESLHNNISGPAVSGGSTYRGSNSTRGNQGWSGSNRDNYSSGNRSSQRDYHYGDPNPHMGNSRNEGYEATRGTGWRSEGDSGRGRGNYSGYGFGDKDRYERQDNSYRYGGQGRRYSDFGRDEGRTFDRNRGYNAANEDSYYDRSDFKHSRHDNDFGRDRDYSNRYYDGNYDDSDFRYEGEVKSTDRDRDDNYATGLYASNRAYVSDHNSESDGERRSSRERRHGYSGPDYSAYSSARSYGRGAYRG